MSLIARHGIMERIKTKRENRKKEREQREREVNNKAAFDENWNESKSKSTSSLLVVVECSNSSYECASVKEQSTS